MLMFERVAIGTGSKGGISRPHSKRLIAEAQKRGTSTDPIVRQQLMDIYANETAKSLGSMRTRAEMKAGKAPGPGGSLGKLHGAVIAKKMRQVIPAVVGDAVMAWSDDGDKQWSGSVLATYMSTIAGGTDEIQRNIIGDRVLGLPREPSVDKTLPFNELKVGTQS
jgi:alkylation response protein AidB-like acyl-CoA dehydrogenase